MTFMNNYRITNDQQLITMFRKSIVQDENDRTMPADKKARDLARFHSAVDSLTKDVQRLQQPVALPK
jgi:hypothetical protein